MSFVADRISSSTERWVSSEKNSKVAHLASRVKVQKHNSTYANAYNISFCVSSSAHGVLVAVARVSHASMRLLLCISAGLPIVPAGSCRCTELLSYNTMWQIRVVAHLSSRPCTCRLLPMCILQSRVGGCPASDGLMRSRRKATIAPRRVGLPRLCMCICVRRALVTCSAHAHHCCDSMRDRHGQDPPVVSH